MSMKERVLAAFEIWAEVFGKGARGYFTMVEFAAYLGDPVGSHRKPDERDFIVNVKNPEVMAKVDKILGPHGRTLLMAAKVADNENRIA